MAVLQTVFGRSDRLCLHATEPASTCSRDGLSKRRSSFCVFGVISDSGSAFVSTRRNSNSRSSRRCTTPLAVTGNICFVRTLHRFRSVSVPARNVLRSFYGLRRRCCRCTITLYIRCCVVRLLCRPLYPQCRSAPFTSLLTRCFGRSESRAEAAALCFWAHLAGARNHNLWRFITCVLYSVHPVVQGTCFA
jgi:hypothetical protein